MTDPYVVLNVPRNASDDEIKTAYRNLAKKYHPDNYANAPDIADVAADKMREVNEAYDTIVKERKNGGHSASSSSASSSSSSSYSSGGYSYNPTASSSSAGTGGASYSEPNYDYSRAAANETYSNTYSTTTSFEDVRRLILEKRFDDANAVLEGVPTDRRNAEWNFLKGTVLYNRGWLEQAYVYLKTATDIEPNNSEFRAAFNQVTNMRRGKSGGYRVGKENSGCGDPCNMCCSLLCADQCCECCGGDLITCC